MVAHARTDCGKASKLRVAGDYCNSIVSSQTYLPLCYHRRWPCRMHAETKHYFIQIVQGQSDATKISVVHSFIAYRCFAFSDDHGNLGSGVLKQTAAGSFYSSQETMDEGSPFSDVVVVSGELVFLSGLVGTDVEGELVDGGLVPESHAIFRQMQNHLDQMGLDLDDVVKCLVMIDNIDEWADFNKIYTSYFKPPYPARSAFGADGLALDAALELECTAVKR